MKIGGYLRIDHSASPGLPEAIANKIGFDANLTKEGKIFEADTLTCSHCHIVIVVNPNRTRERGFCHKCNYYICDNCVIATKAPGYNHMSWEQLVDKIKGTG